MSEKEDNSGISAHIPDDVISRAGHALADLLSPFTELMGLWGDGVRARRLEMAKKLAISASHIAGRSGQQLHRVPDKVMYPLLEYATLESDDSELNAWWAQLLVTASMTPDAAHGQYVNVLSRMTPNSAQFLDHAWRVKDERVASKNDDPAWMYESSARIAFREHAGASLENIFQHRDTKEHLEDVLKNIFLSGFLPIDLESFYSDGAYSKAYLIKHWNDGALAESELINSAIYESASLGVIEIDTISYHEGVRHARLRTISFTPLGIGLMSACRPQKDEN